MQAHCISSACLIFFVLNRIKWHYSPRFLKRKAGIIMQKYHNVKWI